MAADLNQPVRSRNWLEIWVDAWIHPSVSTFQSLLLESNHTAQRGLIWIAIVSVIAALISGYTTAQTIRSAEDLVGSIFLYYICIVILTPILSIIGMVISSGIYHWIAKLLDGNGVWSDLVFCLSAVSAPASVVAIIIVLVDLLFTNLGLPFFIFVMSLVSLAVGIYTLVLYIFAIQAVEKISSGRAALTVFIPVIIAIIIAVCVVLTLVPAISRNL